ncbi:DDE superfamily endonuclease [Popillia japonica]|uniref:DDE superfamily endonuclease n=1 Tax=Popillia japonica TaxID=7064 RepID=A0AAW1IDV6_POPJA
MDEKGCRLNLNKEPKVVLCANAIGSAMPPMILSKGKRMKPEFADDLPPCSVYRMTEKGYMTTKCFVDWLHHFGSYKPPGFRATGLFPFDPNAIPEIAYQPSTASHLPLREQANPHGTTPIISSPIRETSPQPGTSGMPTRKRHRMRVLHSDESDPDDPSWTDEEDERGNSELDANTSTFSDLLPTPIRKTPKMTTNAQKAINSRAVVLKKSLFSKVIYEKHL